jgi:hypothetical protein
MVVPAIAPIGPVQRHAQASQAHGFGAPAPKKASVPSEGQASSRQVRSRRARVGAPARHKKRANGAKSKARADGCVRDARGLGRPRAEKKRANGAKSKARADGWLREPSAFHAMAQLLQLAPHGTSTERVSEDRPDQERGGDIDDVFEGHGTGAGRSSARRAQSPVCGSLAIALCSSLMRASTLRVFRQVCRMKKTVHNHIST